MNEYKNVKVALRNFILLRLAEYFPSGGQVFRALPRRTDVQQYPVAYIRNAVANKIMLGDDGPTVNDFVLTVRFATRAASSEAASDQLDAILQAFDAAIATYAEKGLDASLAVSSRWLDFSRLNLDTTFDNAMEDALGLVVYGCVAPVRIQELTTQLQG